MNGKPKLKRYIQYMSVLEFRPQGIYCRQGDFYIDPWHPVERALITHGHSDHADTAVKNTYALKLLRLLSVIGLVMLKLRRYLMKKK